MKNSADDGDERCSCSIWIFDLVRQCFAISTAYAVVNQQRNVMCVRLHKSDLWYSEQNLFLLNGVKHLIEQINYNMWINVTLERR